MTPEKLLNRIEPQFPRRTFYFNMHLFLGMVLGLERNLRYRDYAQIHSKELKIVKRVHKNIKTILSSLNFEDPESVSWKDWLEEMESAYTEMSPMVRSQVRHRFFLASEDFEEFMERVRKKHHQYLAQGKKLESVMFYAEIFARDDLTQQKIAQMLALTIPKGSLSPRYIKVVEVLNVLSEDLQQEFPYFHHLYLYQQGRIDQFDQQEILLLSDPDRSPFRYPRFSQRLERFFRAQGLENDLLQRAILYDGLGLSRVSPAHLASLLESSPSQVASLKEKWMSRWRKAELISSVIPGRHEELKKRFLSLSPSHLDLLAERLFKGSISGDHFASRLYQFYDQIQHDPSRSHIFMAIVLRLEQPSPTFIEFIGQHYFPQVHFPVYSVRTHITHLSLEFQKWIGAQMAPTQWQSSQDNASFNPKVVNAILARRYKELSQKQLIRLQEQWGYFEEDSTLFKRKLDSFVQKLQQSQPLSWSLFLSRELGLMDLSIEDFSSIFAGQDGDVQNSSKDRSTNIQPLQQRLRRFFYTHRAALQYDSKEEFDQDLVRRETQFFQSAPFLELLKLLDLDYPPSYYPALTEHLKECVNHLQVSSADETFLKLYIWKVMPITYTQGADLLGKKIGALHQQHGRILNRYKACVQNLVQSPGLYVYHLTKRVSKNQRFRVLEEDLMARFTEYYESQQFISVLREMNLFSSSLSSEVQGRHVKECVAIVEPSHRVLLLSYVLKVQGIPHGVMADLLKIPENQFLKELRAVRQNFIRCLQTLNQRLLWPSSSDQNREEEPWLLEIYQSLLDVWNQWSESQLRQHLRSLEKKEKKLFSPQQVRVASLDQINTFAERYQLWERVVFFALVIQLGEVSIMELGRLRDLSFEQILELSYLRDRQQEEFLEYLDTTLLESR